MDKAVGQQITLIRTNPATGAERSERAKVLAANGGIVLQACERIEVLGVTTACRCARYSTGCLPICARGRPCR
jgi:hypothetical protein